MDNEMEMTTKIQDPFHPSLLIRGKEVHLEEILGVRSVLNALLPKQEERRHMQKGIHWDQYR